jgi:hypothetical protein
MAGLLESTVIRAVCKKMLQILLRHLLSFFIKFFFSSCLVRRRCCRCSLKRSQVILIKSKSNVNSCVFITLNQFLNSPAAGTDEDTENWNDIHRQVIQRSL